MTTNTEGGPSRARAHGAVLALLLCLAATAGACAPHAAPASALPEAGEEALVRPGDRVSVRIWREAEMSDTVRVDEDGIAVLPRLGPRELGGTSARAAQREVREEYETFLRDPAVEVTVLRRVGIHGEVSEPSLYLVDLTTTLRELIALAGGITEAGNPGDIVIVRGQDRYRLSRQEVDYFRTAELRSGDQVVVGRRGFIERNPLALISTASALVSTIALLMR